MPADCSAVPAPAHPLGATVGGEPVAISAVALHASGTLGSEDVIAYDTLRLELEGDGGFELGITVAVPHGEPVDGRTYRRVAEDQDEQPGFADGTSEVQGWRVKHPARGVDASFVFHSATLRVEFGKRRGPVLPGRVWFCAPEIEATQVAGAFEARVAR